MVVKGIEEYSIDEIVDNFIMFSKDGALAYAYDLDNPVHHSIDEQDYDVRHDKLVQAFTGAPDNSYLHKQDIYLRKRFNGSRIDRNSFLGDSVVKHFDGKLYTDHTSSLFFTLPGLSSLKKAYLANPFSYDQKLHSSDRHRIEDFENYIKKAINVLGAIKNTSVNPKMDLDRYVFDYINGFSTDQGLHDIDYLSSTFGKKHFSIFSFSRPEYYPDEIPNIVDSTFGVGDSKLKEGYVDFLGEQFLHEHIVNQVVHFVGKKRLLKEIERARGEYSKFRSISPFLEQRTQQLDESLKYLSQENHTVVKYHSNVILMADTLGDLARSERALVAVLNTRGINYDRPKGDPLVNCFRSSIPGRSPLFHKEYFYTTDLAMATALFTHTTVAKDDEHGIYVNDRISQRPLKRDWWDEQKLRMNARNSITIASTGGGKSVATLRKITQFLEQSVNIIVVEFGKSFEFITKLYPEISKHIKYTPDKPLGINPFQINGELDYIKIGYLASVIMKCWRVKEFMADTHILVSLNKIIKHYYDKVNENRCFQSFYDFIIEGGTQLLDELEIEHIYFDLKSFKHNCSEFVTGGIYENIFKVDATNQMNIADHQLVVFELDQIKNDPFLVTLILLVVQDTIDTNILSDRSKKGMLIFDEFAETQAIRDLYTDAAVLESVAILYQKIRKENGAVQIIIQDISQLPDNQYTQSIRANSQVIEVLPSKISSYKAIKDTLSLPAAHYSQMCSINNNYSGERPYSEMFVMFGETHFEVVRQELSSYEYLAFQTEGKIWKTLSDEYDKHGDLKKAIVQYQKQTS